MSFSDPKHPIWDILKVIVFVASCTIIFQFGYNSGLVKADIIPIVGLVATFLGINKVTEIITNKLK